MTHNAKVLIAGISYYIEGSGLEISRNVIRSYSRDDLAAAKEAIEHLVREGAAAVVRDIEEAKEEDVCLVMLKYPGGKIPFAGWSRWFNRTLAKSSFVSPETLASHLIPE